MTGLTPAQSEMLRVAFRPHAPIEDPANFVGREVERERVTEALHEPGLQVVVFGERGAGKTSLANVATKQPGIHRIQVFCEINTTFSQICRDILFKYELIKPGTIKFDAATSTIEINGASVPTDKITGNLFLRAFTDHDPVCIILDELDRVQDKEVISQLSELAKNISTYHTYITLVFIGVSTNADELLNGHISNFRNLRQVQLDRMTQDELKDIIKKGETKLGITFSQEAVEHILQICDRFPYYLHLLATNSARSTLSRRATIVSEDDLLNGISKAAADADQSLREVYEHAILSVKQSAIYRRIIWAMASLDGPSHTVGEIAGAIKGIAAEESAAPGSVQAVGQALVTLKSDAKKRIVTSRTQRFYSFTNPLMKGFVRLVRARK